MALLTSSISFLELLKKQKREAKPFPATPITQKREAKPFPATPITLPSRTAWSPSTIVKPTIPTTTFRPTTYTAPDQARPTPTGEIRTGGQTTRRLLTSTLEEARRRARLTGRKLSAGEVEGTTRGFFAGAAARLAARKGLQLQERGQDITMRGQDISADLGYAGLTSREKIAGGELGLGYAGLTSAERIGLNKIASLEKMYAQGLISVGQLQAARISAEKAMEAERIKLGYYQTEGQMSAAERAMQQQRKQSVGMLGGMAAGAAIGSAIPGVGTAIGAGVGALAGGLLGDICIIITACTSRNSPEVNIARVYRDEHLDATTRAGYYWLSGILVPFILKHKRFKYFIKKWLVDSIVDHSLCVLGDKDYYWFRGSKFIMVNFLRLCKLIGYCMTDRYIVRLVLSHL